MWLLASLRLINGHNSCSGRVEVLYNGVWGTVCDNGWDLTDAAAVCREIGCGDVIEAKSAAHFGQGSGPVWISDLQCSDTDSRLRDCKSSGWGRGSCGHEKDAGVICKGESKPFNNIRYSPYRTEVSVYVLYGQPVIIYKLSSFVWAIDNIRLVSSANPCSGRVEVLRAGQWGTVCDDGWDASDAAVVCKQLGCGTVLEVKSAAYFGEGSGTVWMNNVNCFGNEPILMSCSYNATPNRCGHEKDAGVICGCKCQCFHFSEWGNTAMCFIHGDIDDFWWFWYR